MSKIRACPIPDASLLHDYARGGGYADCYVTEVQGAIALPTYVEAFYTTWLFKVERAMLTLTARPSTDAQAKELAAGRRSAFAAWSVEKRAEDQLLMCDFAQRTRSWFMTVPTGGNGGPGTRLYFGSAITAVTDGATGRETIGGGFQALLGFHKLYSRALLGGAKARLERMGGLVSG